MPPVQRPVAALGLRLLAVMFGAIMLVLTKISGQRGVWLPEVLFWRQLMATFCILGWLAFRKEIYRLRTDRPWDHVRRALLGTVSMYLTFTVVQILPLAEATVLGFSAPLFAVMLSAIVLREKVGPWRWGAVLLGFSGVLVTSAFDTSHLPLLGVSVGIAAAFMVALTSIQIRDLSKTEEPLTIVFYFTAFGVPALAPSLLFSDSHLAPVDWLMIGAMTVAGFLGQMLLTLALRLGTVSSVIVMDYTHFIWAALLGWLVFDNLPPASTWIGAPLIIVAGLIIAWRQHIVARERAPHAPVHPDLNGTQPPSMS